MTLISEDVVVLETDMDNGLHMLVGSVGVLTPCNL